MAGEEKAFPKRKPVTRDETREIVLLGSRFSVRIEVRPDKTNYVLTTYGYPNISFDKPEELIQGLKDIADEATELIKRFNLELKKLKGRQEEETG